MYVSHSADGRMYLASCGFSRQRFPCRLLSHVSRRRRHSARSAAIVAKRHPEGC
jgi:hypothetical protein